MDYIFSALAILTGIHIISYGLWVKRQDNLAGALFLIGLALLCAVLPIIRLIKDSG